MKATLAAPKLARRHWDILMRTYGLHGDYPVRSTYWTRGILRADARRLLAKLQAQPPTLHD